MLDIIKERLAITNEKHTPGPSQCQPPAWQAEWAASFRRVEDLLDYLGLPAALAGQSGAAARLFAFRVPKAYADKIRPGDPDDPLLRQVLPSAWETVARPGYTEDAVGDRQAIAAPGLLHKYHGRVLLITTGACAVHCRYCFRRGFDYPESQLTRRRMQQALAYIAADDSIAEVILSGGDPLALDDGHLADWLASLDAIPHVRRIRFHTRLPVVLPARVNAGLAGVLSQAKAKLTVVIHANHPNELDAAAGRALALLRQAGAGLLNQSVLLRGVNDRADTLAALSEALFGYGVLPYYLHLLDKASGTGHFDVPTAEAVTIHRQLQTRLPGYLVPRLVREVAGMPAKIPVMPADSGKV